MKIGKTYLSVSFFILVVCLSLIGCSKRTTQPVPKGEKIEIDKNAFLQFVEEDLKIKEEEALKARFQTEIIMPGDIITLTIYEKLPVSQEERTEKKRVDEQGKIFLLPIGEISLKGLRIAEAESLIEDKFSYLVVSPHCEIQIEKKQYEPRVYVFGEVGNSGSMKFRSGDRLLDALSSAGGCAENAYRRSVKLIRVNNNMINIYSIDLYDIFKSGNIYKNMALQDQDIIFIPRRFLTGFREIFQALSLVMPWYVLVQGLYLQK